MNKLIEMKLRKLVQKEIKSVLKEDVDRRYIEITIKNIKNNLDDILVFFDGSNTNKIKERLNDIMNEASKLKKKI